MAGSRPIVFVGPGVMAEAIAAGLIERAGWPPEAIVMSGPRLERLRDLAACLGVRTQEDSRQAAAEANVVVLSVKPPSAGWWAGSLPVR
jgi:pyrroline-5-carboxylate reductase